MQPAAVQSNQPQLYELCSQFEQMMLASLLPESLFHVSSASGGDDRSDPPIESGQGSAIFTQAFSAAMQRAGGVGLAREMYRLLAPDRR
ncbi:MAG TPA: hypothetical protein VN860_06115 [Candidatus Acidoferrales bacterium]|nr:hypothetical protein [Candidatus Acidoferrales bacterium]